MGFRSFGEPFGSRLARIFGHGGGGNLTPAQQFATYDDSLAWVVRYRFNETSGTTVVNSGSLASGDAAWSPGVGALGQTGKLGPNQAYLLDGANSIVTGPTSPTINNATAFTHIILVNLATAGEGQARLITNTAQNRQFYLVGGAAPLLVNLQVNAATINATATTNTGLSLSTWTNIFITYDDTGDRKPHIYFGTPSGVVEAGYTVQVAASGALTNGSGSLFIGNRAALSSTLDGLVDEYRFKDSVLSLAQMTQWNQLALAA